MPESDLPDPPPVLDTYALEEWNRLALPLHTMGLLYEEDQKPFAAYCMAYSRWRLAEEEIRKRMEKAGNALAGLVDITKAGNIIQNVLVGIANKAASDMVRYGAEFGLTPRGRTGVAVDSGRQKKSKYQGLIGGQTNKH